jgi:phage shock protein A
LAEAAVIKNVIYWLMGDRAGLTIVATWNWLWGKPVQKGGQMSAAAAEDAINQMQQEVFRLAESVAQVTGAHQSIRDEYTKKHAEMKAAESQAAMAQRNGYREAARLAMTKAIQIEQVVQQLAMRLEQAEKLVHQHQHKLQREREKLELYKVEYQNLQATVRVDDALDRITRVSGDLNITSARNQFDASKQAIADRHHRIEAFVQLAEDPHEKLQYDLDQLTLNDAVEQRLQALSLSRTPENSHD